MENKTYDIVIIGSGPAGLTAGIYAARAALKVVIIGGAKWGGQLMQTTEVENFPGFPNGILGPELMANMRKQAEKMGAEILDEDVTKFEIDGKSYISYTANGTYISKSVIAATGAAFNWLCLPNEQRLIGRGVSSCATCDAAFFKNKKVAVVGGGDAAMEEALELSKFANELVIIHRRDTFRASKVMQERVLADPKIKVRWDSEVTDVLGEQKVTGVKIINNKTNKEEEIQIDGLFVAIGHNPATELFKNKLELDEKGYLKRFSKNNYHNLTSAEGVFVAGDVHDIAYKQAITAAGYGCQAALEAERWLCEQS